MMPLSEELSEQYRILTESAGMVPLAGTLLEITGADAPKLLHNFCTNNITALAPGKGCEAFITNASGKTIGFVLAFRQEGSILLNTTPEQADILVPHFNKYIFREDAAVFDRSGEWSQALICGWGAAEAIASSGEITPPAEMYAHVSWNAGGEKFRLHRIPYTQAPAYLLTGPANLLRTILAQLQKQGVPKCSPEALEMARIEAGWPLFGTDIDAGNLPQEVNRDKQAISFTKGCYLGQETVARIDALGHVNKLLVGIALEEASSCRPCMDLSQGTKDVGKVMSSAWSPRLEKPLALAYVRRGSHAVGTELNSPLGKATVVTLPVS